MLALLELIGIHSNHNWGAITDGYQYCEHCGKARPVKCNHVWETILEGRVTQKPAIAGIGIGDFQTVGKLYHLRCTKCGVLDQKEMTL